LPEPDAGWLEAFAGGLFALADRFDIELVGGDTTRGPCAVTVQVLGIADAVLARAGARPGQAVMVTGSLGDAALALDLLRKGERVAPALLDRLNRPEPRVDFGRGLVGIASAAIDISDGVYADLGHVLTASGCGATIELQRLPRSAVFDAQAPASPWRLLGSGDDYELCFTVDAVRLAEVNDLAVATGVPVTRIGTIEAVPGLRCMNEAGEIETLIGTGYDHFA
jgi:thiamine-monophosphate kinase